MVIKLLENTTLKLINKYVIENIKKDIDYIIMRPSSEVSVGNLPVLLTITVLRQKHGTHCC